MVAASFALKGILGYGGLLIGTEKGQGYNPADGLQDAQGQGV